MNIRRRVMCKDGTTLSVQAGRTHYCTPRVDDAAGYTHVEVGYITAPDGSAARCPFGWKKYQDGSVYGYVPVRAVERLIRKHGGAISGELPPFDLEL